MSEPEKACPPSTERSTKRRKEMRVRAVSLSTAGRRAVGQPDKEGQRHDKQQGKDLMVVSRWCKGPLEAIPSPLLPACCCSSLPAAPPPCRHRSSLMINTGAQDEAKLERHPEISSPGQSRGPHPLGLRAPVIGAATAAAGGGGLKPALLLHRCHPAKSALNPAKFASDFAGFPRLRNPAKREEINQSTEIDRVIARLTTVEVGDGARSRRGQEEQGMGATAHTV
nr:unnamed protein product [Digitaria exilis]